MSIFKISNEDNEKIAEWRKVHIPDCVVYTNKEKGAIGGLYTFCFTPTSLGTVTIIKCACGEEFNFTDFGQW